MFHSFRNCVTTQRSPHHSLPNLHHIHFTGHMFRNSPHFFQKESITTQYSSSKSVHIWQDYKSKNLADFPENPDFTQLIWRSSIKIHIKDSQKLNYLKYKAIVFGRNSHLLVSNPLLPKQRHLDQY